MKDQIGYQPVDHDNNNPIMVDFTSDQLIAAARDPRRAERMLGASLYMKNLDEYKDMLKAAFKTSPILILRNSDLYQDAYGSGALPDNLQHIIMDAAHNPQQAYDVIYHYRTYKSEPWASEVYKIAAKTRPLVFLTQFIRGYTPHDVLNDPSIRPTAADIAPALKKLKGYERKDTTAALMGGYDKYASWPEGRAILQAAIDNEPVKYIKNILFYGRLATSYSALTAPDAPDAPRPSIESLRNAAQTADASDAKYLVYGYGLYKDMPGAHDVLREAIRRYPLAYFQATAEDSFLLRNYNGAYTSEAIVQELRRDKSLFPSAQNLLDTAADDALS